MRSSLPRSSSTRPTAAPSPLGFIDRPGGRGGRADLTTGPLGGISHRTSSLIPRPPSACITLDRPLAQPHSTQFTCPRNRIKANPAEIVVIEGESYRRREAELSQKQRRAKQKRR